MANKILASLVIVLMLSGCSSLFGDGFNSSVVTKNQPIYPNLPDISIPTLSLLPTQHDIPRDTSLPLVVNREKSECISGTVKQNDAFWIRCGLYPIQDSSNLFRGYDRQNWNNLIINQVRIDEHIKILVSLINLDNQQRQRWRELNKNPGASSGK